VGERGRFFLIRYISFLFSHLTSRFILCHLYFVIITTGWLQDKNLIIVLHHIIIFCFFNP